MRFHGLAGRGPSGFAWIQAVLLLATGGSVPAVADGPFVVQTLAEGVHLFRPAAESLERTNSLVVEQRDGLVVVDAQPSPDAARELLAAIREVSDRPVRFLLLSHPHAESAGGATAFPATTVVIGSEGCVAALKDPEFDFGAEVRALAEDPAAWAAPERRLPTLVLYARAALDDPVRRVEVLPIGRAHSNGDLLVHVPEPDVMYVGSLLFADGNPHVADGKVDNWLSALNQLIRQSPRLTVGLRGGPASVADLSKNRDSFAWLKGQVSFLMVDRPPVDELARLVLASDGIAERFDPEAIFLPVLVDRVIQDAIEHRRKRGQPYP